MNSNKKQFIFNKLNELIETSDMTLSQCREEISYYYKVTIDELIAIENELLA